MSDLSNRTVVVVGASAGIGLAAAKAAAADGARVVMVSRDAEKLEAAAKGIDGQVETLAVDMLDRAEVESAMRGLGELHHLVLVAAGDEYALFGPIAKTTEKQVEQSFDKLRGFVNFVSAVATRFATGGSLTLVSGAGAVKPPKETALAAASNAGVVALGKAMAVDLAPVRSNVVMPGAVDTGRHGAKLEEIRAYAEKELPARHFGQPEEIADAILFVMKNPYLTGHTLVIDGGLLLQ